MLAHLMYLPDAGRLQGDKVTAAEEHLDAGPAPALA